MSSPEADNLFQDDELAEIPENMRTELDSQVISSDKADLSTRVILVLTIDIGNGIK